MKVKEFEATSSALVVSDPVADINDALQGAGVSSTVVRGDSCTSAPCKIKELLESFLFRVRSVFVGHTKFPMYNN